MRLVDGTKYVSNHTWRKETEVVWGSTDRTTVRTCKAYPTPSSFGGCSPGSYHSFVLRKGLSGEGDVFGTRIPFGNTYRGTSIPPHAPVVSVIFDKKSDRLILKRVKTPGSPTENRNEDSRPRKYYQKKGHLLTIDLKTPTPHFEHLRIK